eukprot:7052437-Pyramimonas_sp.AAC.1
MGLCRHGGGAIETLDGASHGATKRARGTKMWRGRHADGAIWTLGGAPDSATKRAGGASKCGDGAMRTAPSFRRSSSRGHGARERRAKVGRRRHADGAVGT